jgi:eukaryotic-like serine/threonine-protein kinase
LSTPSALPIGRLIAGYRLHRLLGSGAHGTVYLAIAADGTPAVALKLLTLTVGPGAAAAEKAFLDTAAAAQSLHHPDIVSVLGAGVEAGQCWLAMEPVPGVELGRYTRPPRLLPEALVLQVCQRIAQALAHAHRKGVVHRDIKPANVLVHWPSSTVKLTDFGLARLADSANTATGMMLGSPAYMAPEQLAGDVPTGRSDLYALGVTLFELLTGQAAFPGPTMGELLRQITQGPTPNLQVARPDLPPSLAQLVARLLARSAADRPPDGDAVALALADEARHLPAGPAQAQTAALRTRSD